MLSHSKGRAERAGQLETYALNKKRSQNSLRLRSHLMFEIMQRIEHERLQGNFDENEASEEEF